jgi:uncharacterized integral membrane protein
MQIFLFISLFVAAIAVLFALQNTAVVEINFLFWNFEGSLALLLLIALALGALISFFASLPSILRRNNLIRNLQKKITELESRVADQVLKLSAAEARLQDLQAPASEPGVSAGNPLDEAQNSGKSLWQA